jgi:transposase-like protein
MLAVRWYLRYGLSYRDVEELVAERGLRVDHVTIYRWVHRFTPLLIDAARPCRHAVGRRWLVDETYVRVAGVWTDRTASRVIAGHAFVQNVRRGHYELGVDALSNHVRLAAAFDELVSAL